MRASRSRSSARRSRHRPHRRSRRVFVVILAVALCCATMLSLVGQLDAASTNDTSATSDRGARKLVSTDPNFPIYTDPAGTYVPIETVTPEIIAIFTISPCSGFSPKLVTSPRSVELVAAMRAEALRSTPLLDIPLDAELQYRVFTELCYESPEFFALIMAIAEKESQFNPELIGDLGRSYGITQLNTIWHLARMAKYGITDPEQLFDPFLCMMVSLDYLDELMRVYQGSTEVTHYLLALYNAGPGTANRWWKEEGITSSAYSRHVMANYELYLAAVTQRLAEVQAEFNFF